MAAQFKFVHCADLHLGARFRGVSNADPAQAKRMTDSVFESFTRIIDMAIGERADAMFIAGDAFDEETITPRTRMFLADELERVGIPVFMVRGNHDPVTSWEDSIPFPDNVHVFGTEPERIPIPGVDRAEAIGASFKDWHDSRNLPSMMVGSPDMFTVACVHCDVDNPSSEYAYSPCSLTDFRGKGVDYWALGHIHKRSTLLQDPWVVYPGNIQGRSFKETGEKGAYLITVTDGRVSDVRFFPTQGIVWCDETIDIGGLDINGLVTEIEKRVRPGSVMRLTLVGIGPLDIMAREQPEEMSKILSSRLGCIVASIDARTHPEVDLLSRRNDADLVGLAISSGLQLSESGKSAILDALSRNAMCRANMEFYSSLSEEELKDIVMRATSSIVSRMVPQ